MERKNPHPVAILLALVPTLALAFGAAAEPLPLAGPPRPVALQLVASGLDHPTSIVHTGDSRLFLTLQPGRIVIVSNGQVLATPFLDIHDRLSCCGEQGLLSVAFHPRYSQNGYFFVDYTDTHGDTVVSRYQVSAGNPNVANPASEQILLHIAQPFSNHNGGELQFGPDGYLYIGLGDGGSGGDPGCRAQGTGPLGKILRIDVDVATAPFYGVPPSNPFRGTAYPPEAWAIGLRNPWRFSFDRQTGDLYIGDVGQSAREEIDFQVAGSPGGQNYGWKVMEGNTCFSNQACSAATPPCNSPLLTRPVLDYSHDEGECAVIGGYVYRGSRIPGLLGAYVFGDLCTGRLWSTERAGGTWPVRAIPGTAMSLNTFGEDSSGELYLATDQALYRLVSTEGGGGGGPVPSTVALFVPATSSFLLKNANTSGPESQTVRFGPAPDRWVPLAGDWNGDGKTTVGLWDGAHALFRLKNSLAGGAADIVLQVDAPGVVEARALPLVGDWDGDGKDGVGLYDPTTSTFYLKNHLTGTGFDQVLAFGPPRGGWLPLAGDWDGDGKTTVGLYDPTTSTFFLKNGLTGANADLRFRFGTANAGWRPLIGDWNGDGKDGIGLYDPATSTFHLRNTLSRGPDETSFRFGQARAGWIPLSGSW